MEVERSPKCRNCGQVLAGAFCGTCGQKATALNPRVSDFLHEFAQETLNLDGKIVRSIVKLLAAPGVLTRDYFEGRHARWVSPIRLYLVFSVLYFAVASLTPPGSVRVTVTGNGDQVEAESLRRIGYESEAELKAAVGRAYARWAPRAMFVLVPVFAWLMGIALRKVGRNYPQHLYFALHVHSAWFAAAAVAAVAKLTLPVSIATVVGGLMVIYGLAYFVLALMRAYEITARRAVLRAAAVMPVYFVSVIAGTMAIVLPVIFGRTAVLQAILKK